MQIPSSPTPIPTTIDLDALNPFSGKVEWKASLAVTKILDLEKHGPAWKFYNAKLIDETLEAPTVVFEGLKRAGFHDAYCYSRKPSCKWVDEQTSKPPLAHQVFLVFVSASGTLAVLDWEYRLVDPNHPGYPKNWANDFVRPIWPGP